MMTPVQFQGIAVVTATGPNAEGRAAHKAKKFKKGVSLTLSETRRDAGGERASISVLTGDDAVALGQRLGVDLKAKQRFIWYRPIKSIKAVIQELQGIVGAMQKAMSPLSRYQRQFEAYLLEHPDKDAAGKPVNRITL